MRPARVLIPVVAAALALVDPVDTRACAIAPPVGAEVRVAEEEAVIVWDAATKTEHFIRKAVFRTSTAAFGFLVPTPAAPHLDEVNDAVFSSLGAAIRPEVRFADEWTVGSWLFDSCMLSKGETSAPPPGVRVIGTAHVAGFDATTVAADDVQALSAWLHAHGFAESPALTRWLERYVADKWTITAFVVAQSELAGQTSELATRAVHMTFQTDRPFYPYREPTPSAVPLGNPPRLLRVWFLSDARYAATLADAPWSATVLFAAPVEVPAELRTLAGPRPVATVFVDESSPRPAIDELYFAPSADPAEIRQPAVVVPQKRTIPFEPFLVLVIGAIWIVRRRRRARA